MNSANQFQLTSQQVTILLGIGLISTVVGVLGTVISLRRSERLLLSMLREGFAMRFLTVGLIVVLGSILALVDKLSAEVTGLLGSIAGYVLGSMSAVPKRGMVPEESMAESPGPQRSGD